LSDMNAFVSSANNTNWNWSDIHDQSFIFI